MTVHITSAGVLEDEDGFVSAVCVCGWTTPPMPDVETLVDALMEHAYNGAVADVVALQAEKQATS